MTESRPAPIVDLTFPHNWKAEILAAQPLILPARHFVYPRDAEEVERGALEVLVHPNAMPEAAHPQQALKGHASSLAASAPTSRESLAPGANALPFLATCAMGFRDAMVPTGLWSCPNPDEICAVSGGYAYMIDTTAPRRFTMIAYRPVLEVRVVAAQRLLLFVGHHSMLAWDALGLAWQSEKLSDEGVTITGIEDTQLRGLGWNMMADQELSFSLDLGTGACDRRAPQ